MGLKPVLYLLYKLFNHPFHHQCPYFLSAFLCIVIHIEPYVLFCSDFSLQFLTDIELFYCSHVKFILTFFDDFILYSSVKLVSHSHEFVQVYRP
jgi:hypothetical protein